MLKITKIGVPSILTDNDIHYMNSIFSIVEKIDNESSIKIYKNNNKYSFNITLRNKNFNDILIKEIEAIHYILDIPIEFSKSIKLSNSVYYSIEI